MKEEQKNKISEEQEKIIKDIENTPQNCPMDDIKFNPDEIDGRGEV